jgi:hypothetical protein
MLTGDKLTHGSRNSPIDQHDYLFEENMFNLILPIRKYYNTLSKLTEANGILKSYHKISSLTFLLFSSFCYGNTTSMKFGTLN